jgi:hypothetical protein
MLVPYRLDLAHDLGDRVAAGIERTEARQHAGAALAHPRYALIHEARRDLGARIDVAVELVDAALVEVDRQPPYAEHVEMERFRAGVLLQDLKQPGGSARALQLFVHCGHLMASSKMPAADKGPLTHFIITNFS